MIVARAIGWGVLTGGASGLIVTVVAVLIPAGDGWTIGEGAALLVVALPYGAVVGASYGVVLGCVVLLLAIPLPARLRRPLGALLAGLVSLVLGPLLLAPTGVLYVVVESGAAAVMSVVSAWIALPHVFVDVRPARGTTAPDRGAA